MTRSSTRRTGRRTRASSAVLTLTATLAATLAIPSSAGAEAPPQHTAATVERSDFVAVTGTNRRLYHADVPGDGFTDGGGRLLGAPAMARYGKEVYFVAVGTDRNVYVRTSNITWRVLGPTGTDCSGVSIDIRRSTGAMAVACRGANGKLYVGRTTVTPGQLPPRIQSFRSLGGAVLFGTLTGVTSSDFYFDVVGTDHLVYRWTSGTGFRRLSTSLRCYGPLGSDSFSNAGLACRARDGALTVVPDDSNYSAFATIVGKVVGRPGVAVDEDGTARYYVLGTDDKIYVAGSSRDGTIRGFRRGPAGSGLYGLAAASTTGPIA